MPDQKEPQADEEFTLRPITQYDEYKLIILRKFRPLITLVYAIMGFWIFLGVRFHYLVRDLISWIEGYL